MAFEKQYTAKQAAFAVLEKVGELLKKSELAKSENYSAPSEASGQGDVLPRSKSQEKWQEKCESCGMPMKKGEKHKHAMSKGETENSKKLGYKLPEAGRHEKEAEASDKSFAVEGKDSKSSNDARQASQPAPGNNPKEQAEGNNELAGTTPTQVGQDGKNKPGYDEMKGHLKLAKWIGRMEHKRLSKKGPM